MSSRRFIPPRFQCYPKLILSRFYKEELEGDDLNYIHSRQTASGLPLSTVLQDASNEAVVCAKRVSAILKGRDVYEQSWHNSVRGFVAMHTTNPRYKLKELGLGEEHPLEPFEHTIGEFFNMQSRSTDRVEEKSN